MESILLRLERQNDRLLKENQELKARLASSNSTPPLTRERLEGLQLNNPVNLGPPSSESAEFSSVLPQKERTAAWVRRQMLVRLSTATRCLSCLVALMLTSSLKSRMSSCNSQSTTAEEKQLLL